MGLAVLTILSMISAQQGILTKAWISLLAQVFGWGRYGVPLFFGAIGLWLILRDFGDRIPTLQPEQAVGIIMAFFAGLISMHYIVSLIKPEQMLYAIGKSGRGVGITGAFLLDTSQKWLGNTGTILLQLIIWVVVITFVLGISPAEALQYLIARFAGLRTGSGGSAHRRHSFNGDPLPSELAPPPSPAAQYNTPTPPRPAAKVLGGTGENVPVEMQNINPSVSNINVPKQQTSTDEVTIVPEFTVGAQAWRLPTVSDILEEGSEQYYSEDLIRKQVRIIEDTLVSLGAPVRVQEINQGPVITQFGTEPLFISSRTGRSTKVKVSKIAGLADDLALALSARSIRIQAPIPGKGLVGIEVPNEQASLVSLRDAMESEAFANVKGRLRLGLGQDVSGQAVIADLRSMPHLLVAGATGSGKSVCVNSIIAALLLQNSPDTLRLILVDPKRVELTQYNGIPHLLAPVIVDVDRVVATLRWITREMDSRYRRFASTGARNIEDYNQRVVKIQDLSPIPYIAVLIDELADMMMQAPEETERVICRLAQMSRATGIHLIIATQRPSVDVVTGLIKANFPARIAFAVASSIDSRVILDMPGAERLLGQGDMLFMPPDIAQPLRLQGAFVSDRELDRLITFWRNAVEPTEHDSIKSLPGDGPSVQEIVSQPQLFPTFDEPASQNAQIKDQLLPTSVEIFLTENRASTSLLQRRLRIGYTRAARLMDYLTDMGIVTEEKQGQFRKVNRPVAEELLRSLNPDDVGAAGDTGVFQ
ncbi:MAG: DNA translocase FtsK [Anaerolineales bacterium]|nr:MAG: DNA translocase FtsK [Anaerolineales bacterium]